MQPLAKGNRSNDTEGGRMNSQPDTCRRRIATAAALAASLLAMPAAAQDPMTFCAYQPALDDLTGEYAVTSGPSVLSSGGITIPDAQIVTFEALFVMHEGTLFMYADGWLTAEFHATGSNEPDWVGADNIGGIPVMSTDDISSVLDCDMNSLVRLVGTGIATTQEGEPFDFTIRLFATNDGLLVGANSWTYNDVHMVHRLVFTRTD